MKTIATSLFAVLFLLVGTNLYSSEEKGIIINGSVGHDFPMLSEQSSPDKRSTEEPDFIMPQRDVHAPLKPGGQNTPQLRELPRGQRDVDLGEVIPPDMDDKKR